MRTLRDYAEMEKISKADCQDLEQIAQQKAVLKQQLEELNERHDKLKNEVKKRRHAVEVGECSNTEAEADATEDILTTPTISSPHTSPPLPSPPPLQPSPPQSGKDMKRMMEIYDEEMGPQKIPRKDMPEEEDLKFDAPEEPDPLQQYFESFTGAAPVTTQTGNATTQTGKQKRSTTIKEFVNNEFKAQERVI